MCGLFSTTPRLVHYTVLDSEISDGFPNRKAVWKVRGLAALHLW